MGKWQKHPRPARRASAYQRGPPDASGPAGSWERPAMLRTRFPIGRGGRRALAAVSLAVALSAVGGGHAVAAGHAPGALLPLEVRTDHGLVRGFHQHGAREFLGIPYAAPPIGAYQWRPPQPLRPWRGVRPAT